MITTGIATHGVETGDHRPAEAVWCWVVYGPEFWHLSSRGLEQRPGIIIAAIVDHDDLMRDASILKHLMQVPDGADHTACLVSGWNDHRKEAQRGWRR